VVAHAIVVRRTNQTCRACWGRDLGLKRRSRNPVIQYDNIIAAMHNIGIELYFLRPIQIALPPEWIAIILPVSGIGPVGASKDKITELPP